MTCVGPVSTDCPDCSSRQASGCREALDVHCGHRFTDDRHTVVGSRYREALLQAGQVLGPLMRRNLTGALHAVFAE